MMNVALFIHMFSQIKVKMHFIIVALKLIVQL